MAPHTPYVAEERCSTVPYDVPAFARGQAHDHRESTDAPIENASDIADLKAGLALDPKHIPCGYLYDDKGSQLYEQITKLPEYYPFVTERELLTQHAPQIVNSIPTESVVVELGCGNAEKTSVILHALQARDGASQVHFLGIDVSMEALHMARSSLSKQCPYLSPKNIEMVCADYLEGLKEARARHPSAMLCVLWLGSSVGNLKPEEAVDFFRSVQQSAGPNVQVFLCTDLWKDAATLHAAYCDSQGVTEAFIKNGMVHALHALGVKAQADPKCWEYDVVINPVDRRVEMWLVANDDVPDLLEGVNIHKGERILMEMSRKFTPEYIRQTAFQSDFYVQETWRNSKYSMQMFVTMSEALQRCWQATDALFKTIKDWSVQPIDVRRPFGFYYGHLASFAKLKILPQCESSVVDEMYSRGIDPSMADPSKCHSHPEAPPQWPAQPEVEAYVQQVRKQLLDAFKTGSVATRNAYLAIEHEWMHLETLAYMLAQEQRLSFEKAEAAAHTDGPAGHSIHDSSSDDDLSLNANSHASNVIANGHSNGTANGHSHDYSNGHSDSYCNGYGGKKMNGHSTSAETVPTNCHDNKLLSKAAKMVQISAGDVVLGTDVDPKKSFAWDNEGPEQITKHVDSFWMASCPVSNAEFYNFALKANGYEAEEYWDEQALACLKKINQRCPATWTVQANGEVYVHRPSKTTPLAAVLNEPVWVSLAEAQAYCKWAGGRVMSEGEYERAVAHTSFNDSVMDLTKGGWEWTSTPFRPLEGFRAMAEYPEYSVDFFDDCHYVVKGSSPYTHVSLIRQSFRNYYQKEYPYVFAKFRICKDEE